MATHAFPLWSVGQQANFVGPSHARDTHARKCTVPQPGALCWCWYLLVLVLLPKYGHVHGHGHGHGCTLPTAHTTMYVHQRTVDCECECN